MTIAVWQGILVVLIAFCKNLDRYGTEFTTLMSVFYGWLVGLILGDPITGLAIGSTCQLMNLGVAGLGGSSVPDYPLSAIVGTTIAVMAGGDQGIGLTVGIAVGLLGVQFDVIAKLINGAIARKARKFAEERKYGKMLRIIWLAPLCFGLDCAIPVAIVLFFGSDAVNFVLNTTPAWFTAGLSIAGKMLPVIGMAMLLNFMPAKKFLSFVLVGYVLAAYLGLSILPVAMIGAAAAYEYYKMHEKNAAAIEVADQEGGLEDE